MFASAQFRIGFLWRIFGGVNLILEFDFRILEAKFFFFFDGKVYLV